MKRENRKLKTFILAGGFVFLLTLFVEGPSRNYPHPFFAPLVDIPRRLPFGIFAGIIVGLYFSLGKSKE